MITSFFGQKRKAKGDHGEKNPENAKRLKINSSISQQNSDHVQDLLSNLTDSSWRNALSTYTSKSSFSSLAAFVVKERKTHTVYPPPSDTFTALNLVPLDKVKVVIVGQDPYHGPGQGHGLSFSVKKGVKIPPSLRNIYKELLNNECGINSMPQHGYLERWAKQGVLMLNAVLTVRKGEANSHKQKGWEDFTDEVIRCLFTKRPKDAGGMVFLLWGKPASKKAEAIINRYSKNSYYTSGSSKSKPVVICSSHPSPLGATKTKEPFIGSKCFLRTNAALEKMGLPSIDWDVDGNLKDSE